MVSARLLSLYLARSVLLGIGLTCVLLVSIYTLIDFIREARSLSGSYGAVEMLWYLAQTLPRRLYDIFPFAALIGTLLGLGGLAAGNELVAMRAAGFDRGHLSARIVLTVALCLVLVVALAEWVIPDLETRARAERQQARTGQLHVGKLGQLWLRDGASVLRLGQAFWLDEAVLEFSDVLIYRLDDDMRPEQVLHAAQASHQGGRWLLRDARWRDLDTDAAGQQLDVLELASGLNPELFVAAVSRPRLLAAKDLQAMRTYLSRSGLEAGAYEQAFWARIFFPLNVLTMVLVGLPFVFRGARSGTHGAGLFTGVALGLVFFVLTRVTQSLGLVWPLPLWFSSLLPAAAFLLLGLVLLRRL